MPISNINCFTGIGRLTNDPKLFHTAKGLPICSMYVAINKYEKDSDGNKTESPVFIECVAFGKRADNCDLYLNKGSLIGFNGEIQMDNWNDKEGNKRSKLKVVLQNVQFLDSKGNNSNSKPQQEEEQPEYREGEIPF